MADLQHTVMERIARLLQRMPFLGVSPGGVGVAAEATAADVADFMDERWGTSNHVHHSPIWLEVYHHAEGQSCELKDQVFKHLQHCVHFRQPCVQCNSPQSLLFTLVQNDRARIEMETSDIGFVLHSATLWSFWSRFGRNVQLDYQF